MTLTAITEGLQGLLEANNYNPETIKFYRREWNKIGQFLHNEYGDEELFVIKETKYLNDRQQFDIKNIKMGFIFDWREKEGYDVPTIVINDTYII